MFFPGKYTNRPNASLSQTYNFVKYITWRNLLFGQIHRLVTHNTLTKIYIGEVKGSVKWCFWWSYEFCRVMSLAKWWVQLSDRSGQVRVFENIYPTIEGFGQVIDLTTWWLLPSHAFSEAETEWPSVRSDALAEWYVRVNGVLRNDGYSKKGFFQNWEF